MQPYRSPSSEHYRVSFGDDRRSPLLVLAALLALGLSIASVVVWVGGRHGTFLFLSLGGLLMLLRRRSGSIDYVREDGELRVTSRSLLSSRTDRVVARGVTGLAIQPGHNGSELDLRLLLTGDRSLLLLRSNEEPSLEAARDTVQGFLVEHGLLPEPDEHRASRGDRA